MEKHNIDTFIQLAREKHGNKYNYDNAIYVNSRTKLIITCPEHGDFEQTPAAHKSYGCKMCGGTYKKSISEFIKLANQTHNNFYDYTNTIYSGINKQLNIICPIHGKFTQIAASHIAGASCTSCKLPTFQEFEIKANQIHNNKYTYIEPEIFKLNNKIQIICPTHGKFKQNCHNHAKGHGCPKCSLPNICYNFNDFKNKASRIHNNKYKYKTAPFRNNTSYMPIICPKHGEFIQKATNHLNGHGCVDCGGSRQLTTSEFITRASNVHNNKYMYNNTHYKNSTTHVIITCPEHGDFEQTPPSHLKGRGCPSCAIMGGYNSTQPGILYLLSLNEGFKIGITNHSVQHRYNTKTQQRKITIIFELSFQDGSIPQMIERQIKREFKNFKIDPTTYSLKDGATECYTANPYSRIMSLLQSSKALPPTSKGLTP